LARHVSIAREDRGQSREVLVGGVGREDQDRGREELHHEEADRVETEHPDGDLRVHRALFAGNDTIHVSRQVGDPEEHRDRERAHDRQGGGRVPRLRAFEGGHAVRDRLDTGERGRAL
jgi:hypothetical protein